MGAAVVGASRQRGACLPPGIFPPGRRQGDQCLCNAEPQLLSGLSSGPRALAPPAAGAGGALGARHASPVCHPSLPGPPGKGGTQAAHARRRCVRFIPLRPCTPAHPDRTACPLACWALLLVPSLSLQAQRLLQRLAAQLTALTATALHLATGIKWLQVGAGGARCRPQGPLPGSAGSSRAHAGSSLSCSSDMLLRPACPGGPHFALPPPPSSLQPTFPGALDPCLALGSWAAICFGFLLTTLALAASEGRARAR